MYSINVQSADHPSHGSNMCCFACFKYCQVIQHYCKPTTQCEDLTLMPLTLHLGIAVVLNVMQHLNASKAANVCILYHIPQNREDLEEVHILELLIIANHCSSTSGLAQAPGNMVSLHECCVRSRYMGHADRSTVLQNCARHTGNCCVKQSKSILD